MRLLARELAPLEFVEGTTIDGYSVEGPPASYGERELIYDATGPDGEAVSLVMAVSPMTGLQGRSQFRRLARIRAGLQHSALLPVQAVGIYRGKPYLATRRYPAETFADLLDRSALSPGEVLTLLAPVCNALDVAAGNGLIHQALSSTSILVDDSGALLLDGFGVAGGVPTRTVSAGEMRDVCYIPPEQRYGEPLSPASTVYSVACLLVESLSGEPGQGGRAPALAYLQLMDPSLPLTERSLGLGARFDEVIGRGMALKRRHRPGSVGELLSEAAEALGVTLPEPEVEPEPQSEARPVAQSSVSHRDRALARPPASRLLVAMVAALVAGLAAGALIDPIGGSSSSANGPSADALALERLDDRRTPLRATLSASDTPDEQAAAAAGLAAAHARAARASESPRVASAARAAELAYEDLQAAAEAGAAERYAAASDSVARAEDRLAAVAGGLR